jgi:hypothetical protein
MMFFVYFIFIFKHILINVFEEGTSHPQTARTQSRIKKLGAAAIGDPQKTIESGTRAALTG